MAVLVSHACTNIWRERARRPGQILALSAPEHGNTGDRPDERMHWPGKADDSASLPTPRDCAHAHREPSTRGVPLERIVVSEMSQYKGAA